MKVRILVSDDERSGRVTMEYLLQQTLPKDSYVLELCSSLGMTVEKLQQDAFDILFLDINFKGVSSFEIVSKIPKSTTLVFVTAYAEHTIQAIRNNAFDYLLKPVREEELRDCLKRYESRASLGLPEKTLQVREKGANKLLRTSDIIYVKGHGPYSMVCTHDAMITIARTLKSIAEELGDPFVRTHKSYLVNRSFIQRFHHNQLILENNLCLPISRSGIKNM